MISLGYIAAIIPFTNTKDSLEISRQMKKFSIQTLDSDRSDCMAAICYSGPITAVPTNEQFLGEKRTCSKFLSNFSKAVGLNRLYTDG